MDRHLNKLLSFPDTEPAPEKETVNQQLSTNQNQATPQYVVDPEVQDTIKALKVNST
jgi:hypothetical protein